MTNYKEQKIEMSKRFPDQLEYITCAAIHYDDGEPYVHQPINIDRGFVITGHRHHNCHTTMAILTNRNEIKAKFEKTQGFLTNKNRFVDRYEAADIALAAQQISQKTKALYSEDIY